MLILCESLKHENKSGENVRLVQEKEPQETPRTNAAEPAAQLK
jgi:hypothetical protein